MSGVVQESFGINLRIMQFCCLYSPKRPTKLFRIKSRLLHFSCVILIPVLGVLHLILDADLDLEVVNYNAGFLAQAVCFITKLSPFVGNSDRIKQCTDYFECEAFAAKRTDHGSVIDSCVRTCRRNTYVFLACVAAGAGSWLTKPFFWEKLDLPIDLWLPVGSTNNLFSRSCVYVYLTMGVVFSSLATGVVDPLVAGLALHATSQVKILKDNLQHLSEYAEEKVRETSLKHTSKNDIIYNSIRECVDHHNAIMGFIKRYEECFSPVVLSQISASVFVICFSCLQLSKVESLEYYTLQLIAYFSVILAQIYFYCYYGETLSEETNTLTNAIYMGTWYNYDIKCREALMILMERSKEPITITAGKVLRLSLATFVKILKTSYSLLAVLKK